MLDYKLERQYSVRAKTLPAGRFIDLIEPSGKKVIVFSFHIHSKKLELANQSLTERRGNDLTPTPSVLSLRMLLKNLLRKHTTTTRDHH